MNILLTKKYRLCKQNVIIFYLTYEKGGYYVKNRFNNRSK